MPDKFKIEADDLRKSCLICVNRGQPVVQHSFRVLLNLSVPWENDEYTRAHTRIGFVVEQAGQYFFTKTSAWPHQLCAGDDDSDYRPRLSVICDSCQTSAWHSRPELTLKKDESSSSSTSSSSFVFEPGTRLHFGFYLCYWPNAGPSETSSSSPQFLEFQFDFSVKDLQLDGWDVIKEDRFDDRSRWLNWKGERLDKDYNLRSITPQQFEISEHCLASIPGAALIYINQEDQVALGEQASRLQMIFSGSTSPRHHSLLQIGFVVQQGSSLKGPSRKRFFSKETFPWPSGKKLNVQLLVNQHTTWLSGFDSKKKEIGTSVVLDGSNESLFFGFYIQLDPDSYAGWKGFLREDNDIKFEVTLFTVIAEYVNHGLEKSIRYGPYLRSRLVPGLTRFIRKSDGGTDEERVFQGLSLDGEILVSNDNGNNVLVTLPAGGGEEWNVERSTYPPCAFYDADAFDGKLELLIFGKRTPRYVSKTFANSGKGPFVKIDFMCFKKNLQELLYIPLLSSLFSLLLFCFSFLLL